MVFLSAVIGGLASIGRTNKRRPGLFSMAFIGLTRKSAAIIRGPKLHFRSVGLLCSVTSPSPRSAYWEYSCLRWLVGQALWESFDDLIRTIQFGQKLHHSCSRIFGDGLVITICHSFTFEIYFGESVLFGFIPCMRRLRVHMPLHRCAGFLELWQPVNARRRR